MALQSNKTIAEICSLERYQSKCLIDGFCRDAVRYEPLLVTVLLFFFNRIWTKDGYFVATVPFDVGHNKRGRTTIMVPIKNLIFSVNIPYTFCDNDIPTVRIEPSQKYVHFEYDDYYYQYGEYNYTDLAPKIEIEAHNQFDDDTLFQMEEIQHYDPSTNDSMTKLVLSETHSWTIIYELNTTSTKGLLGGANKIAYCPSRSYKGHVDLMDTVLPNICNCKLSDQTSPGLSRETTPEITYFDVNEKLFITIAVKISPSTATEDMFRYLLYIGFKRDNAIIIAETLPDPCSLYRQFNKYKTDWRKHEYLRKKLSFIESELSFDRLYRFVFKFDICFVFNFDRTSYKINFSLY